MKTFEEKFTAWVDGELKGVELTEFEQELAGANDATLDKIAAHQIGGLLRKHGTAPELRNAEFFNHELMQKIEAEIPKPVQKPERRGFTWSLSRIALAGAFSLVIAFGLYQYLIPVTPAGTAEPQNEGIVQVVNTKGGDSEIYASSFHSDKNHVTVLWLDGLKYIPKKETTPVKKSENK